MLSSLASSFVARKALPRASAVAAAAGSHRCVHIEKRLEELGLELPAPSPPRANYDVVCQPPGSKTLYMSGHLPVLGDGSLMTGRIGEAGADKDYGYEAARCVGLNMLATLKDRVGDLDRIDRVVKVFGIVQSADTFKEQHLVINGCSDLMMEVFGKDVGYHARSAIGTSTLPLDVAVEIEAIFQLKDEETS